MTIEELYQAARLRVRKAVSDDLDADVRRVVNTAIADMKRESKRSEERRVGKECRG